MSNIDSLCNWYRDQCQGEWYEEFGISIDTLDNPGWSVKIDLKRTDLYNKIFEDIRIDRNDSDWIFLRKLNGVFEGFGGVLNLDEILGLFIQWVNNNDRD